MELVDLLKAMGDFAATLNVIAECGCEHFDDPDDQNSFHCQSVTKRGNDSFCNPCMATSVLEQHKHKAIR